MTSRYNIFPHLNVIVERLSGSLTLDEVLDFIDELWADESYDPSYNILVDLSNASVKMNTREILKLSQFLMNASNASRSKVAIITHTPLNIALSLIFKQTMVSMNEVNIFGTWEAACDFMDIDVSDLPYETGHFFPLALPVLT